LSCEVKHEEKWSLVSNIEILITSQVLHFGVTKKDTCLLFHIHVLNLFTSWSNLRFDQDSNGRKIQKKHKNEKPKHIVFLCHTSTKQGLSVARRRPFSVSRLIEKSSPIIL
jgi:hypothetical protein